VPDGDPEGDCLKEKTAMPTMVILDGDPDGARDGDSVTEYL
jgi:hypothetical protein